MILKAVCGVIIGVLFVHERKAIREKVRRTVFFVDFCRLKDCCLALWSCFGVDGWEVEVRVIEEVHPDRSHFWGHALADAVGVCQVDGEPLRFEVSCV